MPHRQFYEVSPQAYLFPRQSLVGGDREQPEEPIRQWCAFELIRAYGIEVTQLEFERPVRVGSKIYRIDILVQRDGVPWLVVECKQPGNKKNKEAMEQAISYAGAQEIQAEFAVYTNGHEWQVQRRICGQWVPVTDLPVQFGLERSEPITEFFRGMQSLAPLLHKLDETLEGNDAQTFLKAMQVFFNGRNLFTDDVNGNLLSATDNLLRAAASGDLHPEYRLGKLETARQRLDSYFLGTGIEIALSPVMGEDEVAYEMQMMYATIMRVVEHSQGLATVDALLLRLDAALLDYGRLLRSANPYYPPIKPGLHGALRGFLNYALAVRLNATLPDQLDHLLTDEMKDAGKGAWERFQKDEQSPTVSFGQLLGSLFSSNS